jgi:biotin carboxyl carrier protein
MWAVAAALWCTLGQPTRTPRGAAPARPASRSSCRRRHPRPPQRRAPPRRRPPASASPARSRAPRSSCPPTPSPCRSSSDEGRVTRVRVGGVQETVHTTFAEGRLHLELRGVTREFHEPPPKGAESDAERGGGDGKLYAPTSGRVVAVHVAPRDRVRPGQTLVVLEAMKIENALAVGVSGTVAEVKVVAGDQVPQGRLLVAIDPRREPRRRRRQGRPRRLTPLLGRVLRSLHVRAPPPRRSPRPPLEERRAFLEKLREVDRAPRLREQGDRGRPIRRGRASLA